MYYLAILYLYGFHRLIFFFYSAAVFHPSGVIMVVCCYCSNRCLGEVPRCVATEVVRRHWDCKDAVRYVLLELLTQQHCSAQDITDA